MNLAATDDNVILQPIMASDKSVGGIVLPGARGFEDGAVIISIGPDVNRLVVGDIVVRPDPPRYTVSDDNTGEIYLICAEVDILAKILPEVDDAADQADKTEEAKEEAGGEGGEVHADRVPESRMDHLLPLRPFEGLPEDNGNSGMGPLCHLWRTVSL